MHSDKTSGDTGTGTTTHDAARRALGDFLRHVRDRAAPGAQARTTRRRVRGLRREEVALDAGISVTWYTWLEQGRTVRVSRRTVDAIARALRLTEIERGHLRRLAVAARATRPPQPTARPSAALRRLVASLEPHAAYAINARWDVLCANESAARLLGPFDRAPGVTDNVLRRLVLDPAWRALFEDWEAVAASAIAQFRAATGHLVGDPGWQSFVARLRGESAWFDARWTEHALAPSPTYTKVVSHPTAGRLSLVYSSLAPAGEAADVRVTVYMPDDDATAERLRALVRSP